MAASTMPSTLPTSRLLAGTGELTLRVRGSGHDGRLIRIRSPKCTVGSAAGCTLRLRAAGVEPLHCWILRGSAGAVVRKLHGPATLNGAGFADSPLNNGDRLRLGSVELEVVECSSPTPVAGGSPFPALPEHSHDSQELETRLTVASERIARLEGETRQGFQSSIVAADRADQLRDALSAAHQQLAEACRELAAAQETMTRQTSQIDKYRGQLSEIETEEDELAEQLLQARQAAESAGNERLAREAEAAELQARLTAETQQWQTERTQIERRLQQREAELEAVRSTVTAQTGAMTMAMAEAFVDPETLSAEAHAAKARAAELEQQLSEQNAELETLRRLVGEQSIVEGRVEHLQRELEAKTAELAAANGRSVTAAEQSRRQEELEGRAKALALQEADLIERVARVMETKQQLTKDRDALEAARIQFTADQEAAPNTSEREAELERQTAELEKHIEAANSRLHELDELRNQLGGERTALDERAHRLSQRQRDLETKESDFEKRWTQFEERREEVERQVAQIETQREGLEQEIAAHALQQQGLEQHANELAERQQRLVEREQELERQLAAIENHRHVEQPVLHVVSTSEPTAQPENQEHSEVMNSSLNSSTVGEVKECPPNVTVPWRASPDDMIQGPGMPVAEQADETTAAALPAADQAQPQIENIHDSSKVELLVSRLVQAGLWRGDAEQESVPADSSIAAVVVDQVQVPAESPVPAIAVAENHDDDESIEMYMSRLLKRVRGDSPAPGADAPRQSAAAPRVEPLPTVATAEQPEEPGEYVPRSAAPELPTDLSAMRELANTAARSAIDRHVRKHTGRQAASRLFSAGLTIAASVLLSFWAWQTHSVQATVGAAIGGAVGAYWLLAALRRLVGAMRLSRPQPADPLAKPVE